MVLDLAFGIVLAFFILAVGIPLILSLTIGAVVGLWWIAACTLKGFSRAADAVVAPIRRHPVAAFLVLMGAGLLGAFLFVNQDALW